MKKKGYGFAAGANMPVFAAPALPAANVIRNVLIVPSGSFENYDAVMGALTKIGIQAEVLNDDEPSLEGLDRILIVIPNNNGDRAQHITKRAIREGVQISHAYNSDIVRVLLQALEI